MQPLPRQPRCVLLGRVPGSFLGSPLPSSSSSCGNLLPPLGAITWVLRSCARHGDPESWRALESSCILGGPCQTLCPMGLRAQA